MRSFRSTGSVPNPESPPICPDTWDGLIATRRLPDTDRALAGSVDGRHHLHRHGVDLGDHQRDETAFVNGWEFGTVFTNGGGSAATNAVTLTVT